MRSELKLNAAAKVAVKAFRDAKPWQGTDAERGDKYAELHRGLCAAYGLETLLVRDDTSGEEHTSSGGSRYMVRGNKIILSGRLSVVTYLTMFAFAMQRGTRVSRRNASAAASAFAVKTFKHFFPRSASRCRVVNGLLVKGD